MGCPIGPSKMCNKEKFPNRDTHTHQEKLEYWRCFAEKFGLHRHIRFGHEVIAVTRISLEEKWEIRARTHQEDGSNSLYIRSFDFAIIAVGVYWQKYTPDFKNLNLYKGSFIHGHDYSGPAAFEGKRVLVVGGSFSALEQIAEIIGNNRRTEVRIFIHLTFPAEIISG